MENRYLTYDEKMQLDREIYEHRVKMALMDARLEKLHAEARTLRWQVRWLKFKRLFQWNKH